MPKDYYNVKAVDRKLASVCIKDSHVFCDVGGGWGVDALYFASFALFGVCLDINFEELRKGVETSDKVGLHDKIDYVRATATYLPFCSDSFDVVTSFSVIDHLGSKKDAFMALKEFSRIAKPRGYIVVTVPNKLFIPGTALMKIKALIQPWSFFEQRFTPKELMKYFHACGLTVFKYDSKQPTNIGTTVLRHNLPIIAQRLPACLAASLFRVAERILGLAEGPLRLTLLGARFGVASQKDRPSPLNGKMFFTGLEWM